MIHYIESTQKCQIVLSSDIDGISYSMGGIHTGVFPVFEQIDYKDIQHINKYITKKPSKHMPGFGISDIYNNQISLCGIEARDHYFKNRE